MYQGLYDFAFVDGKGHNMLIRAAAMAICATVCVAGMPHTSRASQAVADKDVPAFMALHWQRAFNIHLPESGSTLSSIKGSVMVTGSESITAGQLLGFGQLGSPEAVAFDPDRQATTFFFYTPSGFVSCKDWVNVNPDRLLEIIKKAVKKQNEARRSAVEPDVEVVDWIEEPTLDTRAHSVIWILKLYENGVTLINANALKLGRFGFERITFTSGETEIGSIRERLALVASAQSFPSGSDYGDYVPGTDKAADSAISDTMNGMLVGAAAKGAATGVFVSILAAIFKSAFGVVLIPIYWAWKWGRRLVGNSSVKIESQVK